MTADFIGAGWAYPLAITPTGGFALASGADKLTQSIQLILSTYPGERPVHPEFGCRLRDYVFRGATLDNATALSYEVERALTRWEPRVDIDMVNVYPVQSTEGLLHIDITYVVKATNDKRNLVFPFYTIPEHEEA